MRSVGTMELVGYVVAWRDGEGCVGTCGRLWPTKEDAAREVIDCVLGDFWNTTDPDSSVAKGEVAALTRKFMAEHPGLDVAEICRLNGLEIEVGGEEFAYQIDAVCG